MSKRVAVVTGASRGIGLAIARELAALGYSLAIVSRSEREIQKAADEIKAGNPDAHIVTSAFDIIDEERVRAFINDVARDLGPIEIMVNNAGELHQGTSSVKPHALRRLMEVNLIAATVFAQAVIPGMKSARVGHIFNVASICGVEAYPDVGAYCASKFGLVAYSDALAQEVAPYGIKVSALCPSWVNTKMAARSPLKPEEMIQPTDLALTIRYLLALSPGAHVREIVIHC